MNRITVTTLALCTLTAAAVAQTPAAKPATKGSPATATPAKPAPAPSPSSHAATGKPIFEVARVNPGGSEKTRTMQVEALGRKSSVQVGPTVLMRQHLRSASAGTEKMKVTSGPKPETREVPVIRLRFTKEGSKAMADLSRSTKGQLLAVLVDGQVIAMPKVTEAVTGSEWTISGNFTADAAKQIVDRINAGK